MTHQRKMFSFLFVKDVKLWYFKYVIGAILLSLTAAALTMQITFAYSNKLLQTFKKYSEQTSVALSLDTIAEILKFVHIRAINAFIIEAIVLIIIGVIMSLYLVHKLMGPLQRLNREINDMLEGKTPLHKVSIRKTDYLAPFVELINKLIESVNKPQEG